MTSITPLGTAGGPGGHAHRSGIASLVECDDIRMLVDAGVGVVRQLAHVGCPRPAPARQAETKSASPLSSRSTSSSLLYAANPTRMPESTGRPSARNGS